MRCDQCNRFVSYDLPPQAEILDHEIANLTAKAQVRIVLTCAECSTELKETEIEITAAIEHACGEGMSDDDFEMEEPDVEGTDRIESLSKKGRAIPARYRRTFYGAEVKFKCTCQRCEEEIELSASGEAPASEFDEL